MISGQFIFVEVNDVLGPVEIKSLKPAYQFTLPLTEKSVEFKLSAIIIDYKISRSTRNQLLGNTYYIRKENISENKQKVLLRELGHYTAICRRSDNI